MSEPELTSAGPEIGPLEESGLNPREAPGTEKVTVHLSEARDNKEFKYSGDMVAVEHLDGSAYIKFTENESWKSLSRFPALSRAAGFSRFFIKNEAQPGKELELQIGGQAGFSVSGVRSTVAITNTDDEQVDPSERSGWPGINHDQETAGSGDTVVQLNGGSSLDIPHESKLLIKGLPGNSDPVYIGESGVGTGNGYPLGQGETIELQVTDVAAIYFYAVSSGDGVGWIVESE